MNKLTLSAALALLTALAACAGKKDEPA